MLCIFYLFLYLSSPSAAVRVCDYLCGCVPTSPTVCPHQQHHRDSTGCLQIYVTVQTTSGTQGSGYRSVQNQKLIPFIPMLPGIQFVREWREIALFFTLQPCGILVYRRTNILRRIKGNIRVFLMYRSMVHFWGASIVCVNNLMRVA